MRGGVDGRKTSIGVGGAVGPINAPTVFNSVFNVEQFWDGRAATLQDQAGGPPLNPIEMASKSWDEIIAKLEKDPQLSNNFVANYRLFFKGSHSLRLVGDKACGGSRLLTCQKI